jgi:sorbitol-specific phosphotransferase system component IIBC
MTDLMTTVEETKESFGCIVSIIYQERKQSLEYQHKRTMQCMFVSMLFCLVVVAAIQIGMTRNDKRHPFSTN